MYLVFELRELFQVLKIFFVILIPIICSFIPISLMKNIKNIEKVNTNNFLLAQEWKNNPLQLSFIPNLCFQEFK